MFTSEAGSTIYGGFHNHTRSLSRVHPCAHASDTTSVGDRQRENFPNGMFIVLVVHGDDTQCSRSYQHIGADRRKTVRLLVQVRARGAVEGGGTVTPRETGVTAEGTCAGRQV